MGTGILMASLVVVSRAVKECIGQAGVRESLPWLVTKVVIHGSVEDGDGEGEAESPCRSRCGTTCLAVTYEERAK